MFAERPTYVRDFYLSSSKNCRRSVVPLFRIHGYSNHIDSRIGQHQHVPSHLNQYPPAVQLAFPSGYLQIWHATFCCDHNSATYFCHRFTEQPSSPILSVRVIVTCFCFARRWDTWSDLPRSRLSSNSSRSLLTSTLLFQSDTDDIACRTLKCSILLFT